MAMWAVTGIGMLINTIQGVAQRNQQQGQLQQMQQQSKAQMAKLQAGMDRGLNIKPGGIMGGPSTSIYVDYPEKAVNNLNKLQTGNLSERLGLDSKMQSDLGNMKDDFFKNNHFKTEFGSKGKGELLLDQNGKPQVVIGPESSDHKAIRENFESQNRLALANKHAAQMDEFTRGEADKAKAFLANNANHLDDAGIQSELQKMIVAGKKKSLKLQQDQDDERWRAEMPPSDEIKAAMEMGMQDLRQMEQRHLESEEKSPDHQQILDYNREFAAVMSEEKEKIKAQKSDENFLLDPRKMMAMATSPPKPRFDQVLPGHLTNSLLEMGIYEV